MNDIYKQLKSKFPDYKVDYDKNKELIEIIKDNIKVEVYKDTIHLIVDNKHITHCHINDFDTKEELYDTIEDYLKEYDQIIKINSKNNIKKIIIIGIILLIILAIKCFVTLKDNNSLKLEGRWTSTDESLIRTVIDYKDDKPVYANENIIEYWLDLKKDGKYTLYFNDIADKSRSNYNIEEKILQTGKYNIDSNKKIYFDSDNKNLPSNSANYIWTCEVETENLHNCTNYAYEFVKSK